ncbi:hypothetical protein QUF80_22675 [Desulfococcaceae bacterium HSG8]|nr:hypothetical protein [Desulfococcaceae bacterium HSG8]
MPNVESCKEDILKKLREAGAKGLNKTGLKINSKIKKQALAELEKEKKIANLETGRKYLYVLKEFDNPPVESYKEDILKKLREAGAKGLNKTGLKINSKIKEKALAELEKERKIANLETAKGKYLYVLKEFDNPLEMAYDRVEEKVISYKTTLHPKTRIVKDCEKRCPERVKKELKSAIDWLVGENKLLELKHRGHSVFIHVSSVQSLLPSDQPEEKSEFSRDQVLEAYNKVTQRIGFSNVEIYDLQQELGVPMDELKAFLLEESRQGRAVLSFGDWPLASEETRSGAIYLNNKPNLLVRFKE